MIKKIQKKAQEEMIGFAVIVVLVSVALIFLLVLYLNTSQRDGIESYEVNSFIQSFLHYTTECEDSFGGLEIRELIFKCIRENPCMNELDPCEVLESTLVEIVNKSWLHGDDRPIKGYELKIIEVNQEKEILFLSEGNQTANFRGALQDFTRPPNSVKISFRVYYAGNQ